MSSSTVLLIIDSLGILTSFLTSRSLLLRKYFTCRNCQEVRFRCWRTTKRKIKIENTWKKNYKTRKNVSRHFLRSSKMIATLSSIDSCGNTIAFTTFPKNLPCPFLTHSVRRHFRFLYKYLPVRPGQRIQIFLLLSVYLKSINEISAKNVNCKHSS